MLEEVPIFEWAVFVVDTEQRQFVEYEGDFWEELSYHHNRLFFCLILVAFDREEPALGRCSDTGDPLDEDEHDLQANTVILVGLFIVFGKFLAYTIGVIGYEFVEEDWECGVGSGGLM